MYKTLRDFIDALDAAGELHRVTAPVSPILEVSAICDRVSKSPAPSLSEHATQFDPRHAHLGGKALLFENVEGSAFPLAINTFGSYRRMEMALNCNEGGFPELADRIGKLVKPETPVGIIEKLKKIPELAKLASLPPKTVRSGPCQEVVKTGDEIDLLELPILKCWPDDGNPRTCGYPVDTPQPGKGRYITFAGIHTTHPETGDHNIGMYRVQVLTNRTAAMHWHVHHDGARHWRAWKKKTGGNEPMPAAIALGGESVLPYAATAPMPPGISELLLAGFLNGSGIEMVPCKTIDMKVPANAEIVIEGYVSTAAGPIGYPHPRKFSPVQPGEDGVNLDDLTMPPIGDGAVFEGPFGDHTGFYSLPDRYPVFTVTAITHRRNAVYPTTIVGPPPQEDYYMGKATERVFLPLLKTLVPDIIDYHLPMFGCFHNCAFIKINKEYPLQARRVMHAIWGAGQMAWTKVIVVVDGHVNVHDQDQVLFQLCANFDPGRDVEIVSGPLDILDHAAPRLGAGHKIGFDATAKIAGEEANGHPVRGWPKPLEMDPATRDLIARRWQEYGLST